MSDEKRQHYKLATGEKVGLKKGGPVKAPYNGEKRGGAIVGKKKR